MGHGPFSHSWDREVFKRIYGEYVEKGHDIHRHRIVKELLCDLIKESGFSPEEIINVWMGGDMIGKAILNGPVGADRIDFVMRDAYYCGTTQFGTVHWERIIKGSTIFEGKLCYKEKVVDDICQALLGRAAQYRNVYYHKTVTAASILLESIIESSLLYFPWVENTKNLNKFVELTDEYVLFEIAQYLKQNGNTQLSLLYERYYFRRNLPKLLEERSFGPEESVTKETIASIEKEWYKKKKTVKVITHQPLCTIDPNQFEKDEVYILSKDTIRLGFAEYLKKGKYFAHFIENHQTTTIRVYDMAPF